MFRFSIGEEVTLVAMTTPWPRLPIQHPPLPQKMVVVERHLQEWYSGTLITYICRAFDLEPVTSNRAGVIRDPLTFTEPELMPWSIAMGKYQEARDEAHSAR